MLLITFSEVISLLIVTFVVGYIFSGYIKRSGLYYKKKGFNIENIKFAILVSAPAIILHELAHKFVAILLGLEATFKAYYFGLGLGIILRVINSPFLILAPAYVQIGQANPTQVFFTAFAGPFINLLLWILAAVLLKKKGLKRKQIMALSLTKLINMWLFIFNMLPIPPLDGSRVFGALFSMF